MSNGFPLNKYMNFLREQYPKGGCPREETEGKLRLCKIRKESYNHDSPEFWKRPYETTGRNKDVDRIIRASGSICRAMEQWTINLEAIKESNNEFKQKEGCDIDGMGERLSGGGEKGTCQHRARGGHWASYSQSSGLLSDEISGRNLRVCQDIVEVIISAYKFTTPKRLWEREKIDEGDRCEIVYQKLREWGGQDIAELIMDHWYTSGSSLTISSESYKFQGKDFFELIQEILWGTNEGEKELGCRRCERNEGEIEVTSKVWCETQLQEELGTDKLPGKEEGGAESGTLDEYQRASKPVTDKGRKSHMEDIDVLRVQAGGERGSRDNEQGVNSAASGLFQLPSKIAPGSSKGKGTLLSGLIGGGVSFILGVIATYGVYRIFSGPRRRGRDAKIQDGPPSIAYGVLRGERTDVVLNQDIR
ncbi:hypothetical protein C922_05527 [Plasmodium inui San Antonio 1]|uniref:Uncharacterized protein n=1 Tax=Plasmodium inui San Antonio 1 TaxID=1237626 RepID=W6ZT59_9APIC|nr:hypothetical protein C922_05527 [Plasmodium inui San Antonio 1]EUD64092.1 hypothetical protein C922_05527 [Plasmodium inui San Antonio 1]